MEKIIKVPSCGSQEEWRATEGHNGYLVSKNGLVKKKDGKPVKQRLTAQGYLYVSLKGKEKGKRDRERVHRLVAKAFVKGDKSLVVNHKNGVKTDNAAENLEWVTQDENIRHYIMVLNGGVGSNPRKLDWAKTLTVATFYNSGLVYFAKREYDLTSGRIAELVRSTVYKDFSMYFNYPTKAIKIKDLSEMYGKSFQPDKTSAAKKLKRKMKNQKESP